MKIFKGDDTGGRLGKALTITVHTKYDLTDCLVFFNYQGIVRKWEGVKDGDTLDLFFSHNETAKMSVGTFKGVMFAVDPAGKYCTIDNAIPITVTTNLRDCYGDNRFEVTVGNAVGWENIIHKPFEGLVVDLSTDDKQLAALGTIIEKLGGTVKASIALLALCAATAFGYTPEAHTNSFVRDGVTYAQRGGLGVKDFVVTNIDASAVGKVKSVNWRVGDVVLDAAAVNALPDDKDELVSNDNFKEAVISNALTVATTNRVAALETATNNISSSVSGLAFSKANKSALAAHIMDSSNPHKVTAEQVGAVPFVEDVNSNKTAVTIGNRIHGGEIGEHSLANGIDVLASGYYSHAEGNGTTASGASCPSTLQNFPSSTENAPRSKRNCAV